MIEGRYRMNTLCRLFFLLWLNGILIFEMVIIISLVFIFARYLLFIGDVTLLAQNFSQLMSKFFILVFGGLGVLVGGIFVIKLVHFLDAGNRKAVYSLLKRLASDVSGGR